MCDIRALGLVHFTCLYFFYIFYQFNVYHEKLQLMSDICHWWNNFICNYQTKIELSLHYCWTEGNKRHQYVLK